MNENKSNEIVIPEPINRPKSDKKVKAEHPKSKVNVVKKMGINVNSPQSRFEPVPVSVELPSHGWLYSGKTNDPDLSKGIIKIRQITLNEEKILSTDRLIQQGKALDMVLSNCIKSDIDPYELLASDRLYILFYLRGMSYGLNYEFSVKCYHCGANFDQSVDIDKLPVVEWEVEEQAKEPIVLELPYTKAIVEAHYMRGCEEQSLTEKERDLKSLNEADDSIGNSIIMLIDKVTLSDSETLSPRDKEDFINHLIAADVDFFREKMRESDCGIQQLEHIYCPRCNGKMEFNVPFGRNFFRRSKQ